MTIKAHAPKATITIGLTDLENVIQRVVKDVVRDELAHVLRTPSRAILEYWEHEGPSDPAGDAALLKDALEIVERYEKNPDGWMTLEALGAESDLADEKAAHRLSR